MEETSQIDGCKSFEAALHAALAEAPAAGWRDLILCDPDFSHWPLGERAVVECLTQWIGGHRHLTLVARHFDEFARRHSRWLRWRAQWSHVVTCRAVPDVAADDVPILLLAPGALLLRIDDPLRLRGRVSREPADLARAREQVDAILQRSTDALPVTTLGL